MTNTDRPASGSEHIEAARKLLKTARTADELRLAQSVLLPLELVQRVRFDALVTMPLLLSRRSMCR